MVTGFQGGNSILRSLKWYKSLEKSNIRNQEGFFIVEGRRAVEQIFTTSPASINEIVVTDEFNLEKRWDAFPLRKLTSNQFDTISLSKTPQGIIAVVELPSLSFTDTLPRDPGQLILVLEHVQDPGNVGTLIRTAAAFDFSGVLLSSLAADPFSPKAVQASAGSLMSLWIRRTPTYLNCLKQLHSTGYHIVATSTKGTADISINASKCLLVLGNEGSGLTNEVLSMADQHLQIPINTTKAESLNVAISGAIIMHSVAMKQG